MLGVTTLGLVVAGCGADTEESATGTPEPGTSEAATSDSAGSTTAASSSGGSVEEALATAYAGVLGAPPSTPTEPIADQSAWVVSCGQQVSTCSTPSAAAVDAAEAIGWTASVCDGQLNPEGWSACIREGISAKSTAILQIGQDCSSFRAALQEAKAADITTIGVGGNDCDVDGGEKEFAATTQKLADFTSQEWWNRMGALQADWIIGKTDGAAQVLSLNFTDASLGAWIQEGFEAELATCADCAVVENSTSPTRMSAAAPW